MPRNCKNLEVDLSMNLRVGNNGRYEHIPSTYSADEIKQILEARPKYNRRKKDYAIILLAVDAGLRVNHVFLRSMAPYCPYISVGHYYKQLNKYFELADINRHGKHNGMHTFRHSLAARLMGDNVPITVISEALGHKYANVTMQYYDKLVIITIYIY